MFRKPPFHLRRDCARLGRSGLKLITQERTYPWLEGSWGIELAHESFSSVFGTQRYPNSVSSTRDRWTLKVRHSNAELSRWPHFVPEWLERRLHPLSA